MSASLDAACFRSQGFLQLPGDFDDRELACLTEAIAAAESASTRVAKQQRTYALRAVAEAVPQVATLANDPRLLSIAQRLLGNQAIPTKATFFDKVPEANWRVPWHQDLSIAVQTDLDDEAILRLGFSRMSIKHGVPHVTPPLCVLENTIAIRLHLDACASDNGALKVIPGSHRFGKLSNDQIARQIDEGHVDILEAARGELAVLSPLILHASGAARSPSHRRVIHLEYSSATLPEGLEWHGTLTDPTADRVTPDSILS